MSTAEERVVQLLEEVRQLLQEIRDALTKDKPK
jgi:hypothetical protein